MRRDGGLRLVVQGRLLQKAAGEAGFRCVVSMAPELWSGVVVCEVALLWDAMRGVQELKVERRENACYAHALCVVQAWLWASMEQLQYPGCEELCPPEEARRTCLVRERKIASWAHATLQRGEACDVEYP
jgi:hypothetical protein